MGPEGFFPLGPAGVLDLQDRAGLAVLGLAAWHSVSGVAAVPGCGWCGWLWLACPGPTWYGLFLCGGLAGSTPQSAFQLYFSPFGRWIWAGLGGL